MTDLPKTIWLLPGLGDEGGAVWCDDPAPGADMDPDDATEYLRADIASARVAEAREQEREACAVVAETFGEMRCATCGRARNNHRVRHPFQPPFGALIDIAAAIRALTSADARAAFESLLDEARAEAWREAAGMFHTEQVRIWAQEILEGLALANVLRIEGYHEKVEAFLIVQREMRSIAAAIRARGAAPKAQEGDA